jgi:hypothetical protein
MQTPDIHDRPSAGAASTSITLRLDRSRRLVLLSALRAFAADQRELAAQTGQPHPRRLWATEADALRRMVRDDLVDGDGLRVLQLSLVGDRWYVLVTALEQWVREYDGDRIVERPSDDVRSPDAPQHPAAEKSYRIARTLITELTAQVQAPVRGQLLREAAHHLGRQWLLPREQTSSD